MNLYGLMARDHWQKYAPSRYATLEDPQEFFTQLGESVLTQVVRISTALERGLSQDMPYLERAAQLRAVQRQAEEIALADLVYTVEPETSLAEELDELLGQFRART